MRAMVLEKIGGPLVAKEVPCPVPEDCEVLIQVKTCGVCRTDLHIVEGDLPSPKFPLILGHQVVGIIKEKGKKVTKYSIGDRVGIPWFGGCCDVCEFCVSGRENLCDHGVFTGYLRQGGYAEYCVAKEDALLQIPPFYDDIHAAPLLCAGLIGYRGLCLIEPFTSVGLYGFGSSAHLLIQVATSLEKHVYVFTRSGDEEMQKFARSLGACWVGSSEERPPVLLDAALLFATPGFLYIEALKSIKKGGKVVSLGIHMSDIPSFPYDLLWGERQMSSVANLTRKNGVDFMGLLNKIPVKAHCTCFPLEKANEALALVKKGHKIGSIVLTMQ